MAVETYEQVPYTSKPYQYATACRMAVVARLFGLEPADPSRARVLEIGCAGGGNLIPRAVLFPEGRYLGIDPAENHVRQAQQIIYALGVDNVEVQRRRVEDLTEADGPFDYIIAHGVFSWIPESSRQALFAACRTLLTERGVAYISYNTLPGWHMRAMIRDAMMFHASGFEAARDRIEQARAMLQFLGEVVPQSSGPWRTVLDSETDLLERHGDNYLFHDHLSPENDPVYVRQFVDMALEHDLTYLGEAELHAMMMNVLPQRAQEVLAQLSNDLVQVQQYMDFVLARAFRHSLLVRKELEESIDRRMQWERVRGMWVGSDLRRRGDEPPLASGVAVTFQSRGVRELTTEEPAIKAAWTELQAVFPASIQFESLVERVRDRLVAADLPVPDDLEGMLGSNVLHAYAQALCELWTTPMPSDGHLDARPKAFAFGRLQAMANADWATATRHQPVVLDQLDRLLLVMCDGTRDRAALLAGLQQALDAGDLIMEPDGNALDPQDELRVDFERHLERLGRVGLLIPAESP